MITTLVAGILVAFLAVTLASALRRAPTRVLCPSCGETTKRLKPPLWFRKAVPGMSVRWCPSCSWEGVGRDGPEWIPGHPAAHDSGFHWGEERLPPDFGFRFGDPDQEPSAGGPTRTDASGRVKVPVVFRWRRTPDVADFSWRGPSARRGGFAWKAREPRPRDGGAGPGFHWKD